jgi:solute carrier family 25 carnitine/acylcarnitine transporter 20/29
VFQAYGIALRSLGPPPAGPPPGGPQPLRGVFLAGCFAGAVQTVVVTPVDLLKIRLQLQTAARGSPEYVGPAAQLRRVLVAEGLRGERGVKG